MNRCCETLTGGWPRRERHRVDGFAVAFYLRMKSVAGCYCLPRRQTPVQGKFPGVPLGSGNKDISSTGALFNCAAVFNSPWTSLGSHPYGTKKLGPSGGPNLNAAPASLSCLPVV